MNGAFLTIVMFLSKGLLRPTEPAKLPSPPAPAAEAAPAAKPQVAEVAMVPQALMILANIEFARVAFKVR